MSVRFLFDENVSPRLVMALADLYPGSLHVSAAGLTSRADLHVWEFARVEGFIIVTKDRDFREFSLDMGPPPKLIWVGLGNCTTARIADLLRREAVRITEVATNPESSLLIIGWR